MFCAWHLWMANFYQEIQKKVSLDILLKSNNIQVVKEMILTYDALFIANNTLIANSNSSSFAKIFEPSLWMFQILLAGGRGKCYTEKSMTAKMVVNLMRGKETI